MDVTVPPLVHVTSAWPQLEADSRMWFIDNCVLWKNIIHWFFDKTRTLARPSWYPIDYSRLIPDTTSLRPLNWGHLSVVHTKRANKIANVIQPRGAWEDMLRLYRQELDGGVFRIQTTNEFLVAVRRFPEDGPDADPWRIMSPVAMRAQLERHPFPLMDAIRRGENSNLCFKRTKTKGTIFNFIMTDPHMVVLDEVVFRPDLRPGLYTRVWEETTSYFFNTWKGLTGIAWDGTTPRRLHEDSVEAQDREFAWKAIYRFLFHLKVVICGMDERCFRFFLWMIARKVVDPSWTPGVVILITGPQGLGKTMFVKLLQNLFGSAGVYFENSATLFHQFNGPLLHNVVFIAVDEVNFQEAAHKNALDRLKTMVTADTTTVEGKHANLEQISNNKLYVLSSEKAIYPHQFGMRRLFAVAADPSILCSSSPVVSEYFRSWMELFDSRTPEGRRAIGIVLAFFLELPFLREYANCDIKAIPRTAAIANALVAGLAPVHRWWFQHLLNVKAHLRDGVSENRTWWVTAQNFRDLYASYMNKSLNLPSNSSNSSSTYTLSPIGFQTAFIEMMPVPFRGVIPSILTGSDTTPFRLPPFDDVWSFFLALHPGWETEIFFPPPPPSDDNDA